MRGPRPPPHHGMPGMRAPFRGPVPFCPPRPEQQFFPAYGLTHLFFHFNQLIRLIRQKDRMRKPELYFAQLFFAYTIDVM